MNARARTVHLEMNSVLVSYAERCTLGNLISIHCIFFCPKKKARSISDTSIMPQKIYDVRLVLDLVDLFGDKHFGKCLDGEIFCFFVGEAAR